MSYHLQPEVKLTRRLIAEVARSQGLSRGIAFGDTLAGDINRFRILRVLRKQYSAARCFELLWEEATDFF